MPDQQAVVKSLNDQISSDHSNSHQQLSAFRKKNKHSKMQPQTHTHTHMRVFTGQTEQHTRARALTHT
jgi:hypothetical protein